MRNAIAAFVRDTQGQDLIEYALLATLIALGCITTMTFLGTSISARFTDLGTSITAAS
jgi:pilus assembly protein Flp/PilA